MKKIVFTAVAAALIALVVGGVWYANRPEPYAFHGGVLTPPAAAPDIALTDQDGAPFSLAELKGKATLLYFGYTTCPDLCPTTLSDFMVVKEDLGPLAGRTAYAMVTIDPERDSAARLKEYLAFFDPEFIGLTGSQAEITAVEQAYGVTSRKVEYPDSATGYLMDHSALIYLIDPEGNLRVTYPYGTDPAGIAADIRHLLEG